MGDNSVYTDSCDVRTVGLMADANNATKFTRYDENNKFKTETTTVTIPSNINLSAVADSNISKTKNR